MTSHDRLAIAFLMIGSSLATEARAGVIITERSQGVYATTDSFSAEGTSTVSDNFVGLGTRTLTANAFDDEGASADATFTANVTAASFSGNGMFSLSGIGPFSNEAEAQGGLTVDFEVTEAPTLFTVSINQTGGAFASFFVDGGPTPDPGGSVTLDPGVYQFGAGGSILSDGATDLNGSFSFNAFFGPAEAANFTWADPIDGPFSEASNWENSLSPGGSDDVFFDKAGTYTVQIDQAQTVNNALFTAGEVTLDTSSSPLTIVNQLVVGDNASSPATLRVTDPANLQVEEVIVGQVDGQNSRLLIGLGAQPSTAAAVTPPSESSVATISTAVPNVTIRPGSQLNLNHGVLKVDKCVVPSLTGPTPVPFPGVSAVVIDGSEDPNVTLEANTFDIADFSQAQGDEAGVLKGMVVTGGRAKAEFVLFSMGLKVENNSVLETRHLTLGHNENSENTTDVESGSRVVLLGGGVSTIGQKSRSTLNLNGGSSYEGMSTGLIVGDEAEGAFAISDQSQADTASVKIGMQAGSSGSVSVSSQTGVSTLNSSSVDVGLEGAALLRVLSGGDVNVSGAVNVSDPGPDVDPAPSPQGLGFTTTLLTAATEVGRGTLIVDSGGTLSADAVNIGINGQLLGTGLVEAANGIQLDGKLAPGASPGSLQLNADIVQTTSGLIEIEIAGLAPGAMYDQIFVDGDATLSGRVLFKFIDGFAPLKEDTFEFLHVTGTADLSGASFAVEGLAPGFQFSVDALSGGIRLTALSDGEFVPESNAATLLLVGVLPVLRHRSRVFAAAGG